MEMKDNYTITLAELKSWAEDQLTYVRELEDDAVAIFFGCSVDSGQALSVVKEFYEMIQRVEEHVKSGNEKLESARAIIRHRLDQSCGALGDGLEEALEILNDPNL